LDEAGLARAMSDGLATFAVRVKDRFGDYGLVGAMFYRQEQARYLVEGLLLSCRVLGRGVEHHMIRTLAERAQGTGAERLDIVYRKLPRNQPLLDFLRTLPGELHGSGSEDQLFQIPVSKAIRIKFDTAARDAEHVPISEAADRSRTIAGAHVERQVALATIARELRDVGAIRARMGVEGRRARRAPSSGPLQNEAEHSIAEIWRQVLSIDGIGRDDNFFDIGGNSLMLVQVNSRLMERLQREIPITDLFQFPTVAALASHLGSGATRREMNLKQSQARGSQAREGMQKRLQQWGARRSVTWKVK
jgi:acyl carrier protein